MAKSFQLFAALWLLSGLVGCRIFDLDPPATVQGQSLLRPAPRSPNSVAIEIVWARFPADDPQLDGEIWQSIDEAPIEPAVARELARNGFRAGVVSGVLPGPLARILHSGEAPAKPRDGAGEKLDGLIADPIVRTRLVQARRGRRVEVQASDVYPSLPLLLGDGRELRGRTYYDAQAMYILEVDPRPDRTAVVQLTPELHHGPPRLRWSQGEEGVLRQASMRDHEVFDGLRLRVKLSPGEMLLLMSLPDSGSRLGQCFHTVESADGRQQKLVLIRLAEVPQSDTFVATQ